LFPYTSLFLSNSATCSSNIFWSLLLCAITPDDRPKHRSSAFWRCMWCSSKLKAGEFCSIATWLPSGRSTPINLSGSSLIDFDKHIDFLLSYRFAFDFVLVKTEGFIKIISLDFRQTDSK